MQTTRIAHSRLTRALNPPDGEQRHLSPKVRSGERAKVIDPQSVRPLHNITADLRARIIQAVKRRAPCLVHDAEDVAQQVLLQVWAKPHLAEPSNVGLLMNHVKYAVLHALRSARRHDARGNARFTSYEQLFDDGSYNASEC